MPVTLTSRDFYPKGQYVMGHLTFDCWNFEDKATLCLCSTPTQWKILYEWLMQQPVLACDTETSGFRWFEKHIVGMSFGWKNLHFYVPVRHETSVTGDPLIEQLDIDDIRDDLEALFARDDLLTIWHNRNFDALFYYKEGIFVGNNFHDTSLLWHLYDENAPKALKDICSGWTYLNGKRAKGIVSPTASAMEKVVRQWRVEEKKAQKASWKAMVESLVTAMQQELENQKLKKNALKAVAKEHLKDHQFNTATLDDIHYGLIPTDIMTQYAALDTYLTYCVYEHVVKNMQFTPQVKDLYDNEKKLTTGLFDVQRQPLRIDVPYLSQVDTDLGKEVEEQQLSLSQALGGINLNSGPQLSTALLARGVPLTKTTKTGSLCVDKKVLNKLKSKYDVVAQILSFRKKEKLYSTFVQGILKKVDQYGNIYLSFNQNVTTGRMSSYDPNCQQIPGGDTTIRRAFIRPSSDYYFIFADYSQVEVRILTHYSQDPLLLDAYRRKQDVHTRTTCEMFGIPYDEMHPVISTDDKSHPMYEEWSLMRKVGKTINFAVLYGVSGMGLSDQISPRPLDAVHLSDKGWMDRCEEYIDMYLRRYLGVRRWLNQQARDVRKLGYAENYFGRLRRLPDAQLRDKGSYSLVRRAERQAANFVIQSTAADVFKVATVRVMGILDGTQSRVVNLVHDEVQFYLHKSEMSLLGPIRTAMEDFQFDVPLVADFSFSERSWADKKGI